MNAVMPLTPAIAWSLLAALLLVATVIDIRERRIPNALTLAGCVAGLAVNAAAGGMGGFLDAGIALLIAFGITLPFWLLGWMGAGDVKLVSAVGAFVGRGLVLETLLAIAIAGGILAALALLRRGVLARTTERMTATLGLTLSGRRWSYVEPDQQETNVRLPYAIAISAGTAAAIVLFG